MFQSTRAVPQLEDEGPGPLASKETTEARIFHGTLHALARQGPKKLTMSDIAGEAGVSAGTLYRYFKNKDDILQALSDYYVMGLRRVLQQAIEDEPKPEDRLRVVVDVMLRYWEETPGLLRLGEMEPGWVIGYIKSVWQPLARVLHDALEPALGESPSIQLGAATLDEVVDLIMRVAVSNYFLPVRDYRELRDLCVALWTAAGLEPKKTRARAGRKAAS
ncbi:TetR/AcrR family transcriptional regulator [Mycobacterium seoulense]|uniref:TetR/AcrR family transcriptional regulator n=1 Tax=Mycobacterium seoulense TaxID=386911 RepID=UPI003CF93121